MSGSDNGKQLIKKFKAEEEEKHEQEELKAKHNIEADVYVVEKNNTFKFLLRGAYTLLRVVSSVVLIVLAAVGILSIVYPETRRELIIVLTDILNNLMSMFGMGG